MVHDRYILLLLYFSVWDNDIKLGCPWKLNGPCSKKLIVTRAICCMHLTVALQPSVALQGAPGGCNEHPNFKNVLPAAQYLSHLAAATTRHRYTSDSMIMGNAVTRVMENNERSS